MDLVRLEIGESIFLLSINLMDPCAGQDTLHKPIGPGKSYPLHLLH